MNEQINVIKSSGEKQTFSVEKLKNSLSRAHASPEEITAIIDTILPKLYEGITTKKIYSEAFHLLRGQSKTKAARYYLKRGLMEFGPTGYPFERFIGELFKQQGYTFR
jgi:transcriptional regulator NrdR family protein